MKDAADAKATADAAADALQGEKCTSYGTHRLM